MKIRMLVSALAVAALGGCAFPIDEGYFFAPRPIARQATDPAEMRLAGQEKITNPAQLDPQLARIPNLKGRLPATVTHEFVEIAGQRIAVTRVKAANASNSEPLIAYCAGQAGGRYHPLSYIYAAKLLIWGEAIIFDYPGYGDSTGEPTLENMAAFEKAAPAWLDTLAQNRPLVLWGHSLGGMICAQIAQGSREADAIVLETTAPNAADLAETRKPWFAPVTLNLKDGLLYDVPAALAGFRGKIVVVGGGKDTVIPVRLARSLAEQLKAAGLDMTYLEYASASHQTATMNSGFARDAGPIFAGVADRN
jgi:pimeloyl-ACP methyl ester carboxylesterase